MNPVRPAPRPGATAGAPVTFGATVTASDGTTAVVYAFAPGAGTEHVQGLCDGPVGAELRRDVEHEHGSSSPPPAGPLPAYLAVVVANASAQSGSHEEGGRVVSDTVFGV